MSTFKRPPLYGDLVLNLLDCAGPTRDLSYHEVLSRVVWEFPGGTFGDQAALDAKQTDIATHNVTNGAAIPDGCTTDWAKEMSKEADRRGVDVAALRPPAAMVAWLAARKGADSCCKTPRVRAQWVTTFRALEVAADGAVLVAGMPAVYNFVDVILNAAFDTSRIGDGSFKLDNTAALMVELGIGSCAGANMDLDHLASNLRRTSELLMRKCVPALTRAVKLIGDLEVAITSSRVRRATDSLAEEAEDGEVDWARVDLDDLEMRRIVVGGVMVRCLARVAYVRANGKHCALVATDVRKVLQLVTGVRNVVAALCCDCAGGSDASMSDALLGVNAGINNMRDTVRAGCLCTQTTGVVTAKLFKDTLAVYKARIAGPLAAADARTLHDDMKRSTVYAQAGEYAEAVLARSESVSYKTGLGIVKTYRLLPPPDVFQARALFQRWVGASPKRAISEATIATFKGNLVEVILTAAVKMPGLRLARRPGVPRPTWWDAYQDRKWDEVPTGDLDRVLEWEGKIPMVRVSRLNARAWKDSGVGADTLEEAMDPNRPAMMRNMMLRLIFDKDCPMPDEPRRYTEELSAALLKPEGAKERIAYSNHLASRQGQSRCEDTVGDVMENHGSFAMKMTGHERDALFDQFSRFTDPGVDDLVTFYYSFDVTGWSEDMALNYQIASHEVWDMATGTAAFTATTANHHKAKVTCNAQGFAAWYENWGANFEGYNGKEMTAGHLAVMTDAVKETRSRVVAAGIDIDPKFIVILLMAYIDDGAARITLPRRVAKEVFAIFKQVVKERWAAHGFTIEEKKSFPSDRFFEFLGEAYYAARHLANGVKAAMRITAEPFEDHETLVQRLSKLTSSVRGALDAGLGNVSAVALLSYFIADEVTKWVPSNDPVAVAAWALTPRGYGGVGVTPHMCQHINGSGGAVEEGMENLRFWARSNTAVKRVYLSLARDGMAARSAQNILRAPLGAAVEGGMLTTDLVPAAVRKALKTTRRTLSPLATDILNLIDEESHAAYADTVIPVGVPQVMQEQVINDLQSATPEPIGSAFLKRLEKKRTLTDIAGFAVIRKMKQENRENAKSSFAAFTNRVR